MNKLMLAFARIVVVGVIMLGMVSSASAKSKGNGAYQTGFVRWRATDGGFGGWTLDGVQRTNNTLQLDAATAKAGTDPYLAGSYNGGNYYNGGSFVVGEALSPVVPTPTFNFTEAIASWNASTPPGTWLEVQFTARYGSRWSKWYVLGIWASDTSTVQRHSVQSQGDTDGYVAVDTFVSTNKKETANAFQLKIRLFSEDGIATPTVRNASLAYSTAAPKSASASPGNPALWNHLLTVPQCSQMVYPDGGEVWCSPTSTSMVLGYWNTDPGSSCADREIPTVEGVFDWIYNGHGNWPFNTAYAATKSQNGTVPLEGYVARFTSLAKAEEYINAGVPVIMSIAWNKGDLTGSSVASTNGHLLVLVGFDAQGNPIVNDPAFPNDGQVQATYLRSEFEPLWLQASGGTVYLIYPEGWSVPPLQ